jgi:uncharacterized protein (DUF302 family)
MNKLGMTTVLNASLDEARAAVTAALKEQGFGVLTEIDVRATLEEKLGVDFGPYRILGACNPHIAHRALTADPSLGLLLPCNVTLREVPEGTEVSIVDPEVMLSIAAPDARAALEPLQAEAKARLQAVYQALQHVGSERA